MKLHDPASERLLLEMGAAQHPHEPPGPGRWRSFLAAAWSVFLVLAVFTGFGGAIAFFAPVWQHLVISLLLMAMAYTGANGLLNSISENGYHLVLSNLPIPGQLALGWFRDRFLRKRLISLTPVCLVLILSLERFSFENPAALAASTALLVANVLATIVLMEDAYLRSLWITRIWGILFLIAGGSVVFILVRDADLLSPGLTPEWMAGTASAVCWVFPISWVLPGRFENGGVWLAVPWLVWGFLRWRAWPGAHREVFDGAHDFHGVFEDSDDDDGEHLELPVEAEAAEPAVADGSIRLPEPLTMPAGGWVDRWVRWVIGKRDLHLAGVLGDPYLTWTARTNRVLLVAPVWLAATWVFARYFPEMDRKETITIWIWILSAGFIIASLMPVSNGLPRAMATGLLGGQSLPLFAALPVSVRDLLRISSRITIARCCIMAAVATPFFWIQQMVFDPRDHLWMLPLPAAVCIFWAGARPFFIWVRLQSLSRRKNGSILGHFVTSFICLILGTLSLTSAVVAGGSAMGLLTPELNASDLRLLPVLVIGGFTLSALSARAAFELFHWRLRRRHYDWLIACDG